VTFVPSNPDALLRRARTALALSEAGYPTSAATLATLATRGGGPQYQLYGRIPVYRWGNSLAWAEGRLSPPVCSSAEAELVRRRQPLITCSSIRKRHRSEQACDHDSTEAAVKTPECVLGQEVGRERTIGNDVQLQGGVLPARTGSFHPK
jgi:hypothetical protein